MDEFVLGRVVLPAQDGTLQQLGYDVSALGAKAFGFVAEAKAKKAYVIFPSLKLSLWLSHNELADVVAEAESGKEEFKTLIPQWEATKANELHPAWWVSRLSQLVPINMVLNFEQDRLFEVWDAYTQGPLENYYKGSNDLDVCQLSVGVDEIFKDSLGKVEEFFGASLLFARFLPAGLHKIELALYVRATDVNFLNA